MSVRIDIKPRERATERPAEAPVREAQETREPREVPEPRETREAREAAPPDPAAGPAPEPGRDLLEAARALDQALLLSDRDKVARLLTSDCRLVGPAGERLERSQWIAAHESNPRQQVAVESSDEEAQLHHDVAVVTSVKTSKCRFGRTVVQGRFRTIQVWARAAGAWRLAVMQYTVLTP